MVVARIGQMNLLDLPIIKLNPKSTQFEALFRRMEKHFITETNKANPVIGEYKTIKKNNFVKTIWPYATKAAKLLGLDPKILVAQAALETGWGEFIVKDKSGDSSNNFFNLKAVRGEHNAIALKAIEFIANTPRQVNVCFRKYSSIEESFKDYVTFIKKNKRYEEALANTHDPERYIAALSRAGYASDPHYAAKILAIYHSAILVQG